MDNNYFNNIFMDSSTSRSSAGRKPAALRRLEYDLKEIEEDPSLSSKISIAPRNDNPLTWTGVLMGPEGTPYENGCFKFTIDFNDNYPFNPPKIKFQSKMFHPNIRMHKFTEASAGALDLKIFEVPNWSTCMSVHSIINVILMCLYEPEIIVDDYNKTANPLATTLYFQDKDEYDRKVRETVQSSYDDEVQTSRMVESDENVRVELLRRSKLSRDKERAFNQGATINNSTGIEAFQSPNHDNHRGKSTEELTGIKNWAKNQPNPYEWKNSPARKRPSLVNFVGSQLVKDVATQTELSFEDDLSYLNWGYQKKKKDKMSKFLLAALFRNLNISSESSAEPDELD